VKKTGRYPSRLEDLENTNNVRFLRKRYKDPVTGKDFKLLHVGEVQMTSTAGIAGAASLVNGANGGPAGGAALAAAGAMMASAAGQSMMGGTAAPTQNLNADASADAADDANPGKAGAQDADKSNSGSSNPASGSSAGGIGSGQLSSAVFGGGPIVGVASTSKGPTIREFNHKNRYNQWQFIYDPSMDRGGLITTPAQPPLQVAAPIQQQNGSSLNSPGSSSSFGGMQSTGGMQNSGGMQSSPPVQPTSPNQN
jgi:hypothetical protein